MQIVVLSVPFSVGFMADKLLLEQDIYNSICSQYLCTYHDWKAGQNHKPPQHKRLNLS